MEINRVVLFRDREYPHAHLVRIHECSHCAQCECLMYGAQRCPASCRKWPKRVREMPKSCTVAQPPVSHSFPGHCV